MKETTYKTIKHWDDNLVLKFVNPELNKLFEHLDSYNISSLSLIDIGGNVGKFYDEISKKYKVNKCEIIEASKMLCEYMTDKYKQNPDITIHNFGLSDEEGIFYFGDEQVRWFEETGTDGSNSNNVNLGLSASHFIHHDNTNYLGATKFYNGSYFLENINKINPQEITFIKVDTENRDVQIVCSMKEYFMKHHIAPIIVFENNYRYFLSLENAQQMMDDLCMDVGYIKVDLSDPSKENIFLLPKIIS